MSGLDQNNLFIIIQSFKDKNDIILVKLKQGKRVAEIILPKDRKCNFANKGSTFVIEAKIDYSILPSMNDKVNVIGLINDALYEYGTIKEDVKNKKR